MSRNTAPHQIQVLGIGKMCLVLCILLISIKKRNSLWFSCISDLHFVTFAAYSVYDITVFGAGVDGAAGAVFRDTLWIWFVSQ